MLYNIAAIVAGFLLLIWSADRFIGGAAATARHLDVSPLIIGLTLVGFDPSAAMRVSIALLLMWWLVRQARSSEATDAMSEEFEQELPRPMPIWQALAWLVTGLVALVISSRILVRGAVGIATELGVSDLLIGPTIIAIGTSLPELAASIAGALKNEHDIAIGNIVGSNMFNTLAVMGIPGLIYRSTLDSGVLDRDVPVVFILIVALLIMAFGFKGPGRINRLEAAILLSCFVGYQVLLNFTEL